MKKSLLVLLMLCLLGLTACSGPRKRVTQWTSMAEPAQVVEAPRKQALSEKTLVAEALSDDLFQPHVAGEYRVREGDLLEVSVFGHTDTIAHEVPVAPDGKLYYYFIDGVPAAGRRVEELSRDIERRLDHLFSTPEVSVIPKAVTDSTFVVLGKVEAPGQYHLDTSTTLREAIAEAGGLSQAMQQGTAMPLASLEHSFIVRDGKRLPVDFKRLFEREGADQDIYVRPGDYIYVASALQKSVYQLGAVYETRAVPHWDGLTLVGMLAAPYGEMGGYTEEAYLRKVLVIRGSLTEPEVHQVDLQAILDGEASDVYLQPGDIVYVTPKKYRWVRHLARSAVEIFLRSFGAHLGEHYADRHWFPE